MRRVWGCGQSQLLVLSAEGWWFLKLVLTGGGGRTLQLYILNHFLHPKCAHLDGSRGGDTGMHGRAVSGLPLVVCSMITTV